MNENMLQFGPGDWFTIVKPGSPDVTVFFKSKTVECSGRTWALAELERLVPRDAPGSGLVEMAEYVRAQVEKPVRS